MNTTSLPPPSPSNPQHQQQNQVTVPIPQQPNTQPPPLPPNLPNGKLIEGSREDYVRIGVPLYEASIKGDWKSAEPILVNNPELVRWAITDNYETPLHIAASAKSTKNVVDFVRNLVKMMGKKDLEFQNKSYNTALSLAATSGNVETAKIMLEENKALLEIPGSGGMMPLYVAALFARADMVTHLYKISNKMSGDFWNDHNRGWVLQKCVEADLFDVAAKIVKDRPELTLITPVLQDLLLELAKKTDAFVVKKPNFIMRSIKSISGKLMKKGHAEREYDALQLLRMIWEKISIMPKNDIDEILRGKRKRATLPPGVVIEEHHNKKTMHPSGVVVEEQQLKKTTYPSTVAIEDQQNKRATYTYPSRVLFVAAKMGNTRFIIELIRSYPDIIWKVNDKELTIFHIAVKRRQAEIYNLLYEIGSMKDLITPMKDKDGNNMLHLVGKSAKPKRFQTVSGVALQMQRELLWFQEVEQMIPPSYRVRKNNAGEEPHDLFTKKHAALVEKGEVWVKETAAQCMVVATLIATIVFAAAYTLPGGYNQDTGYPMFRPEAALIVFVIADAISLIFSSTSVLIFLSILTSRYAEHDFLKSLPRKMMFGLGTLFLSIVTMMVAFSASFFLLYHKKQIWIPYTVTGFAAIPVTLFAFLQSRLLLDIFYSIYGSKYLFKPKKGTLYN